MSADLPKKGYWIAVVDVADAENYARYVAATRPAFEAYGAKPVVRAGRFEDPEGTAGNRHVVVEFESYEQAIACYRSPEYQAALRLREAYSSGRFVIVEGA